ncbi:MAG: hypothetical protein ACFFDY_13230, partial [Candidatus Thorarchaeota archaeon]
MDSSVKESRYTPIISEKSIGIDINEENFINFQSDIVSWGEVLANNPSLSNLDKIISYPDSASVKVREDKKIEFVIKRDATEFSIWAQDLLSEYNAEFYEEISYFNASIVYISLDNLEKFIIESRVTPGIAYVEPNFYIQLDFVPNDE